MDLARIFSVGLCLLGGCSTEAPLPGVADLPWVAAALKNSSAPSPTVRQARRPLSLTTGSPAAQFDAGVASSFFAGTTRPLPNVRLGSGHFLGVPDQLMRERMLQGEVAAIKKGSGGRSLAFKLTFTDGTEAYFKPAQSFSGANWYAEVAAYHLDRVLGLGRVPPVVSRRMPWRMLRPAARGDFRVPEVHIEADGSVRGALIYWLDGDLEPASTPPGFENWLRVETFAAWALSPYKRLAAYGLDQRENRRRVRAGLPPRLYFDQPPEEAPDLAAALSDMVIFDYLTLNIDRWGGQNGNVLTYGPDHQLIFLDNGAGFSLGPPTRGLMEDRLVLLQRFRRSTVAALKAMSLADFERRLDGEVLAPIMGRELRAGVGIRRERVLQHIQQMERQHGSEVYAW